LAQTAQDESHTTLTTPHGPKILPLAFLAQCDREARIRTSVGEDCAGSEVVGLGGSNPDLACAARLCRADLFRMKEVFTSKDMENLFSTVAASPDFIGDTINLEASSTWRVFSGMSEQPVSLGRSMLY
jgi:hypothetical protein